MLGVGSMSNDYVTTKI